MVGPTPNRRLCVDLESFYGRVDARGRKKRGHTVMPSDIQLSVTDPRYCHFTK